MTDITYEDAITQGREVLARLERNHPRPWGAEGAFIELAKQVGDLAKQVMVMDGYYGERENKDRYRSSKAHIEDELVDILTAVIRLADHYDIDLVKATERVRQAEAEFLKRRGL